MSYQLLHGDCLDLLKTLPDNSVDSIVCDPPYGLGKEPDALAMLTDWMQGRDYVPKGTKGFMGAEWDAFVPQPAIWRECLRVLKPGGHIVAFAGTRTQHLMALGLQIAGFELRDMLAWVYGSGFPKSLNISKAIDKAAGAERGSGYVPDKNNKIYGKGKAKAAGVDRTPGVELSEPAITDDAKQWAGFGTSLKPALETITLARKPLCGTVAANVLLHGTGGLNIDGCRVETSDEITNHSRSAEAAISKGKYGDSSSQETHQTAGQAQGRWPANLLHDGSPEVLAGFPNSNGAAAPVKRGHDGASKGIYGDFASKGDDGATFYGDKGSAARFFYCPKASRHDRDEGLEGFEVKKYVENHSLHNEAPLGRETVRANGHPTVKPTALMRWLCRLITPPGGLVLDPFCGSGSTGKAAVLEGFHFIGMEREAEYVAIARARLAAAVPA